ncbi:amidohydrolase family protein [Chromobacterium sp. S0633]|uniref:amidohydrolase family protein n=1 Tax=Chromobacterium sp. S0633 TaxID=2957805 RepID=UPI00209FB113|nr:amidohydrolase family protein [Chromobacterium sp. S0633]MCP1289684.1 amidohydrolase family protein [Chromobacterium sp. S0633]
MAGNYLPVREDWLSKGVEAVIEPMLPIVDAHHHFYERPDWNYKEKEYLSDLTMGHNIVASVYMQALTRYRTEGDELLMPIGETEYVRELADRNAGEQVEIARGIVSYADLRIGREVDRVLQAHIEAGGGRVKGVRHLVAWDADSSLANPLSAASKGLLQDKCYRDGFSRLAVFGLSYDAWLFFPQLPELFELAKVYPEIPVIIDHCGGCVRVGVYADCQDEVFSTWRKYIYNISSLPNVYIKIGGLGMRINGFNFDRLEEAPSSKILAQAWRPWVETCIDAFGPERAMFESNFPVDKGSYSYVNCWNAFKKLTHSMSTCEREALFFGTANKVYKLKI